MRKALGYKAPVWLLGTKPPKKQHPRKNAHGWCTCKETRARVPIAAPAVGIPAQLVGSWGIRSPPKRQDTTPSQPMRLGRVLEVFSDGQHHTETSGATWTSLNHRQRQPNMDYLLGSGPGRRISASGERLRSGNTGSVTPNGYEGSRDFPNAAMPCGSRNFPSRHIHHLLSAPRRASFRLQDKHNLLRQDQAHRSPDASGPLATSSPRLWCHQSKQIMAGGVNDLSRRRNQCSLTVTLPPTPRRA